MIRVTIIALALTLIGTAAGTASAHEPKTSEPTFVESSGSAQTVDDFHAALASGNTAAAAGLLAEDALIFESGGAERSKAEYVGHHLPADAAFAKAVKRTVTHRSQGGEGDTAWVASETRTTGTYKDKPVDLTSTETVVLRRTGGQWRIVHFHWSSAR